MVSGRWHRNRKAPWGKVNCDVSWSGQKICVGRI